MNTQQPIPEKGTGIVIPAMSAAGRKRTLLILGALSLVLIAALIFTPFCTYTLLSSDATVEPELTPMKPSEILFKDSSNVVMMVLLAIVFIYLTGSIVYFGMGLRRLSDDTRFARFAQRTVLLSFIGTGLYYVGGVLYAAMRNGSETKRADYAAGSILPYLIAILLLLVTTFIARVYAESYGEERVKSVSERRQAFFCRLEFLLYSLASLAIGLLAALGDILHVSFTKPVGLEDVTMNGFEALTKHTGMGEAYQSVAFLVLAVLILSCVLAIAITVCFFFRSRLFYRVALSGLIFGAVCSLLVGLFGKYYEIAQAVNEELMQEWLSPIVNLGPNYFVYEVESSSIYLFIASLAVVVAAIVRRPYSRGTEKEAVNAVTVSGTVSAAGGGASALRPSPVAPVPAAPARPVGSGVASAGGSSVASAPSASTAVSDPCPAFSELDGKAALFFDETEALKSEATAPMNLPALVQYVVNYARDSRLHLFYTAEDIATFIAGLGATRLTILQGMSGTGKTSLPKIFTEALFGNCEIVEVESSWRDKNELLGYYNEFSRTYTPKKFTQALYKAALNPERLTFIVLDEMNLSRIEYYFSDFLSLMENEEDKREIKLLNVGLYRHVEGEVYPYAALTDGHTLRVPRNVWFIGTANRDESTFEISDKVYDRAHTMNFNKRAAKAASTGDPIPRRFVSADAIYDLLEEARAHAVIDPDTDPTVKAVEELLAPYNISFGNRIANQISAFVSVYCACFAPSEQVKQEALERILLSKVVCKLEFKSVENKELLAAEFRRRGLNRCSDFILRLSED